MFDFFFHVRIFTDAQSFLLGKLYGNAAGCFWARSQHILLFIYVYSVVNTVDKNKKQTVLRKISVFINIIIVIIFFLNRDRNKTFWTTTNEQ